MPSEAKWAIVALLLTVGSVLVPGGRVLTLPFFFVLVLVLLFWSARASVDRTERRERQQQEEG